MRSNEIRRLCIYSSLGALLVYLGYIAQNVQHVQYTDSCLDTKEVKIPTTVSTRNEQIQRIAQLRETCGKYRHLMQAPGYKKSSRDPAFYKSSYYNWSYCKIGKIVSTLWTKFFFILKHDGADLEKMVTGSRDELHRMADKTLIYRIKPEVFETTRMVVSARNPYSRLFSAYIDRMYIPSLSIPLKGASEQKCKTEYTFSEFLSQVVDATKVGELEYHFSPVFHLCKPCELKPTFVFLQETVKSDFTYVVNQTDLEPHKLAKLYDSIKIHTNWSAFALIEDVLDTYAKINTHHSLDCQTPKEITVRLWEVFQIQGFISDEAAFPFSEYKTKADYKKSDIFRKALLGARAKYPLTSEQKDKQRQKAMNKFYRSVPRKVINKFLGVYGVDFEMFGYSKIPPPW